MRNCSLRPFIWPTLLAFLLCGCLYAPDSPATDAAGPAQSSAPEESVPEISSEPTQPPEETAPSLTGIDAMLADMTLREKVGQLFIVRPDALDLSQSTAQISDSASAGVTVLTDGMREALVTYPVGGIVLFGKNITSPEQVTAFNAAFQAASATPLFLCVDEEGGSVARLANHRAFDLPKYKNAAAIGQTGDITQAFSMGTTIGTYLREYGFNLDFAPVADVNTNPANPIIGTRAFSPDPETAALMAGAMADGLNAQGIIAVFKHFPGHGDTGEDSHLSLAVSRKTKEQLLQCEWIPFLEADQGDLIMVGHIALPEVTGDSTPATLSSTVVTGILKEELGFEGLVITDSLEMGGIVNAYSSGEAAVSALQAGCDILLMPENLAEAFDAVIAAVEDGTLTQQWLDSTVRRILAFKELHGILELS